jgi:hypothetical protein
MRRARSRSRERVCTLCGRNSHTASSCHATTHANGSRISAAPVSAMARAQCSFCNAAGHDVEHCPRTRPYAEQRGAEPPPRHRRIANIQGSSWDAPAFRSWRKEAEFYTGPERICAVLGCGREAVEGAHVWVEGERRAYFIARLCRRCNHRHGDEEICCCRYIGRGEEPRSWMPIRDMWLYKIKLIGGNKIFEPFQEWCRETAPPTHSRLRDRCSRFCGR